MKGMVFTEFLEMVEDKFSPEMADKIIDASDLPSGGAYTSVGTYNHSELIEMVTKLSEESEIEIPVLVEVFGEHLFGRFVVLYPSFFQEIDSCFSFLEQIDNHVHVEVKKLYPEAELPTFKTKRLSENSLQMTYRSERPFALLAEGLMRGSFAYFKEDIDVEITDLSDGQNKHVEFLLQKNGGSDSENG